MRDACNGRLRHALYHCARVAAMRDLPSKTGLQLSRKMLENGSVFLCFKEPLALPPLADYGKFMGTIAQALERREKQSR